MRINRTILCTLLVLLSACAGKTSAKLPPDHVESRPSEVQGLSVRVNIPERKLYLKKDGQIIKSYNVAVGQARYATPVRDFTIGQIVWNPWWNPPESDWAKDAVATPPGPGNPLGPVKMVMQDALLIHGTNSPSSIGRPASHGCIRMLKEDAKDLAWEIQSAHSEQNDPALKDVYAKHSRKSYYVKLDHEVPASLVYDAVEIKNDALMIYPDVYGRGKINRELIAKELEKYPTKIPVQLDHVMGLIKDKAYRQKDGTIIIPLAN